MEGHRFTMPYTVRIADINYRSHVSNAAVLNYFHDGRIAYLANLGPFSEYDLGGCGIILPEARIRYAAEMFLGDSLEIGVRVEEVRQRSFVMGYRIERGGELTAEGTTPIVCFHYESRKAVALPVEFLEAVRAFEGFTG